MYTLKKSIASSFIVIQCLITVCYTIVLMLLTITHIVGPYMTLIEYLELRLLDLDKLDQSDFNDGQIESIEEIIDIIEISLKFINTKDNSHLLH